MVYYHVDVFTSEFLSGNGLTVVFHEDKLETQYMQKIAQEFKQFETIFLQRVKEKQFSARIFTVEEELDFAGHPILGAVAAIHQQFYEQESEVIISLLLNHKTVESQSVRKREYFQAKMNQGVPEFLGEIKDQKAQEFLQALNLTEENMHPQLPMEVISTGLPYLIVPLVTGLAQSKISRNDFEKLLDSVGAKFVYVLDVDKIEGRTWDNLGAVEDVATGSAAGPAGAYLYKRNICNADQDIIILQGSFVKRPSQIKVSKEMHTGEIYVAGDVVIGVKGQFVSY